MPLSSLQIIFRRELLKLKQEIENYTDDKKLWATGGDIKNSAGNLCLHIIGNLNNYIGKELGGTDYVRNRDLEFSQKNITRNELLEKTNTVIAVVETALAKVSPEQLEQEYPVKVFDYSMTTEFFLIHLACHLTYHLGQINYHRRLLDAG